MSATTQSVEQRQEEQRLIELAQDFVETGTGFGTVSRPELFADDFVFRGPIIGPLCKKDYLFTLDTNKVYEAFPDLSSGAFGYTVDPIERNRVWFFTRYTGTNTGTITIGPITLPPTGKEIQSGPEVNSVMFDEDNKVKLFTVGYVVDRDTPGATSDGQGALVGLLKGCGIPFPSTSLFRPIQKLAESYNKSHPELIKSISLEEDIPAWYKDYVPSRRGAEGV